MREEVIQVDNLAFDVDGRLRIYRVSPPPPPSRAESSLSIQFSLPGYVEEETHVEDEDTESLPPPPSYLDCTIPPPVYDDLYPAPRPPKSPKRITRRTWFKMISILGFASLATSLLLIATRSVITQSCTGTPFLIVWCFVSSFIIWSGLTLTVSKKIRKKLNESTSVRPLVLYVVSIFCVSWECNII
ncbi:uncharacterized protein LOC120341427 isoform X2 [Styela clava]|uniref:uncharacterized protein LOC120341427 isoform X2 n=1 Tax=Styela clava TaxID=7725 RepID=UPI00193AABF5|nr:uncharacterized protein LOC120341427 isoform X2 [Styela clava]